MLAVMVGFCSAYEIPKGVLAIGEIEQAQSEAKASGKPIVLVVGLKSQPET